MPHDARKVPDRRPVRGWIVVGTAATMLAAATPAAASVEYYAYLFVGYDDGTKVNYGGVAGLATPQRYDLNSAFGTGAGFAEASDVNGGTASVNASVVGRDTGPSSQRITTVSATAIVTYRFSIAGPSTAGTVPVLLTATGASTGGTANLSLQDGFGAGLDRSGNFDVSQVVNLVPGWGYSLALYTSATVFNNHDLVTGATREAGATVDPTLTIQGPDAQLYHFVGLPDSTIGKPAAAAVPEPAAWAMLVTGFGMLGGALRRRGAGAARFARA